VGQIISYSDVDHNKLTARRSSHSHLSTGITRRCLSQQAEVKELLYPGLREVFYRCAYLRAPVLNMLLSHVRVVPICIYIYMCVCVFAYVCACVLRVRVYVCVFLRACSRVGVCFVYLYPRNTTQLTKRRASCQQHE
jgi:FANCI helical domain 2